MLDFETLQAFLGNNPPQTVINLCKQPPALEKFLTRPTLDPEQLEPDSQEANDAATVSEQMETQAEMMAGYLRSQEPMLWHNLSQSAMKLGLDEYLLDKINGAPGMPEDATPDEESQVWQEWLSDQA